MSQRGKTRGGDDLCHREARHGEEMTCNRAARHGEEMTCVTEKGKIDNHCHEYCVYVQSRRWYHTGTYHCLEHRDTNIHLNSQGAYSTCSHI